MTETKELELKHLVPYLPYGLMFKDLNIYNYLIPENMKHVISLQQKPILHPLSNLTKEIIVDGKKFVPLDMIYELFNEYYLIIDGGDVFLTDESNLNMFEITNSYDILQKLFEWHFDLFDLIQSGLAIDVNTLDKNPYE